MGIRKGADAISQLNTEVAKIQSKGYIPELILYEDADTAIFRFLTDDPLDVDLHEIRDASISKWPQYFYCTMDDEGQCRYCEADEGSDKKSKVRMFMFWVYVHKILHNYQTSADEKWSEEKLGKRTVYVEVVDKPVLLRRKFGYKRSFWEQFESAYDANEGTWKDRDYSLKRNGVRKSQDTTYALTPLDKSIMSPELADIMSGLPSLEDVAKGIVTRLGEVDSSEPSDKETPSGDSSEETEGEHSEESVEKKDPAPEIQLPDVDDDLFGDKE